MDTTLVEDELKRVALETMVKTYGQTPRKLFPAPHPPRTSHPGWLLHDMNINNTNLIYLLIWCSASSYYSADYECGFIFDQTLESNDTVSSSILSTFRAMPENKTIKKFRNAKVSSFVFV